MILLVNNVVYVISPSISIESETSPSLLSCFFFFNLQRCKYQNTCVNDYYYYNYSHKNRNQCMCKKYYDRYYEYQSNYCYYYGSTNSSCYSSKSQRCSQLMLSHHLCSFQITFR